MIEFKDITEAESKPDIKKIIKELVDTDFGGSNEVQAKGLQLLKGLAFSDDPLSNQFMKGLNAAYTQIGNKVLGSKSDNENK